MNSLDLSVLRYLAGHYSGIPGLRVANNVPAPARLAVYEALARLRYTHLVEQFWDERGTARLFLITEFGRQALNRRDSLS